MCSESKCTLTLRASVVQLDQRCEFCFVVSQRSKLCQYKLRQVKNQSVDAKRVERLASVLQAAS